MRIVVLMVTFLMLTGQPPAAQPYQSIFADNGATEWVFIWGNLWGWVHDTAYVAKDTVVHGLTYKKILTRRNQYDGGLLRENTDSGRVWYKDINNPVITFPDTTEKLILDMSLSVGDTFHAGYHNLYPYADSCNIVDSVRYIQGYKYIYFKCQYLNHFEPVSFIEGVGTNMGVITKVGSGIGMSYPYLLCSYKNGQKTHYENTRFNGICWQYSEIPPEGEIAGSIFLSPQPATHEVRIINRTRETITKVQIFNTTGVLVKQIAAPLTTRLDITGLPAGPYFIKAFLKSGHVVCLPMVRQ